MMEANSSSSEKNKQETTYNHTTRSNKQNNAMSKKLFFILFFTLFSLNFLMAQDESYHVVYVSGKIKNLSSNELIHRGSKLAKEDAILFQGNQDKAVLISSDRGRYVLSKNKKTRAVGTSDELKYMVNEVILPLASNTRLSTRATEKKYVKDMANYFKEDEQFTVIGDSLIVTLDPETIELSPQHYFAIRYFYQDKEYKKRIATFSNAIVLKRKKIFVLNKDPENPQYIPLDSIPKVDIFEIQTAPSRMINQVTSFQPHFLDQEELRKDFIEVLKMAPPADSNDHYVEDYLVQFFYDVHGTTDEKTLRDWIDAQDFESNLDETQKEGEKPKTIVKDADNKE